MSLSLISKFALFLFHKRKNDLSVVAKLESIYHIATSFKFKLLATTSLLTSFQVSHLYEHSNSDGNTPKPQIL